MAVNRRNISGKKPPLSSLKLKVTTEKDLFNIYNYFFDYFGEDIEFLDRGERVDHEELKQVILAILHHTLDYPDMVVLDMFFIRVPDDNFIHGACPVMGPDKLVNYFYFEDIDSGLMAVCSSPFEPDSDDETQMVRFSLERIKASGEPTPRYSMN